jgi:hypothetical protein
MATAVFPVPLQAEQLDFGAECFPISLSRSQRTVWIAGHPSARQADRRPQRQYPPTIGRWTAFAQIRPACPRTTVRQSETGSSAGEPFYPRPERPNPTVRTPGRIPARLPLDPADVPVFPAVVYPATPTLGTSRAPVSGTSARLPLDVHVFRSTSTSSARRRPDP